MPQLSEFLLIQLNCVVAVEQVLYVLACLSMPQPITVYPGKSSPVETAIGL